MISEQLIVLRADCSVIYGVNISMVEEVLYLVLIYIVQY